MRDASIVTTQVPGSQAMGNGDPSHTAVMAASREHACFLMVERARRTVPDIICWTFPIPRSLSAWVFVEGMRRLIQESQHLLGSRCQSIEEMCRILGCATTRFWGNGSVGRRGMHPMERPPCSRMATDWRTRPSRSACGSRCAPAARNRAVSWLLRATRSCLPCAHQWLVTFRYGTRCVPHTRCAQRECSALLPRSGMARPVDTGTIPMASLALCPRGRCQWERVNQRVEGT
jgi:hypothetical protein